MHPATQPSRRPEAAPACVREAVSTGRRGIEWKECELRLGASEFLPRSTSVSPCGSGTLCSCWVSPFMSVVTTGLHQRTAETPLHLDTA